MKIKLNENIFFDIKEKFIIIVNKDDRYILKDDVSIMIFKLLIDTHETTLKNINNIVTANFDIEGYSQNEVYGYIKDFISSLNKSGIISCQYL